MTFPNVAMATHTIRKHAGQAISHAVVPLNRVNHVFARAVAGGGATLREQTEDALEAIAAVMWASARCQLAPALRFCANR